MSTTKGKGALATFKSEPWIVSKLRSERRCARCLESLPKGTEAWRPAGNPVFRADRVCEPCMDKLEDRGVATVLRNDPDK